MAMSLGCCSCWSTIVSGEISVTRSSFFTSSTQRLSFAPTAGAGAGAGAGANLRMVRSITCAAAKNAATGKPRGIMKPKPISPLMQELLGVPEIARTEALKKIWAYIKEHNLQDPENKKVIVCDEKLKKIFAGKERVGFLEISGLINPHFLKPAAEES